MSYMVPLAQNWDDVARATQIEVEFVMWRQACIDEYACMHVSKDEYTYMEDM